MTPASLPGFYRRPTPHVCPVCKSILYVDVLIETKRAVRLYCDFGCWKQVERPASSKRVCSPRLPKEITPDQEEYHAWGWLDVKCPCCAGPLESRRAWSRLPKVEYRCVACGWLAVDKA